MRVLRKTNAPLTGLMGMDVTRDELTAGERRVRELAWLRRYGHRPDSDAGRLVTRPETGPARKSEGITDGRLRTPPSSDRRLALQRPLGVDGPLEKLGPVCPRGCRGLKSQDFEGRT